MWLIFAYPTLLTHSLVLGDFYRLLGDFNVDNHIIYKWDSSFLPFQSVCFLFLYLAYSVARTPTTVLNTNNKNGQSCLFPDISGKEFSLSLLSKMLAVGSFCGLSSWCSSSLFTVCWEILSWMGTCLSYFLNSLR